jgi:hypothetical protein
MSSTRSLHRRHASDTMVRRLPAARRTQLLLSSTSRCFTSCVWPNEVVTDDLKFLADAAPR